MLTKNQVYEARIEDYTSEGQGVAKIEGCAVFVPNAIAGELCRIRIEKARKAGHPAKSWKFWRNPPTASIGPALWPSSAAAAIFTTWTTKRNPG